jgi:uncharacterized protein involved in type VI secretion and phage assembly
MNQFSGVCPAIVIDNADPDNSGRVKVRFAHLSGLGEKRAEAWARIATLMAGDNRGTWFIPDVKDEVLIAFEAGDISRPYVIGALWNGAKPPETMDANNTKKVLRSRGGIQVTLADQDGEESFVVETPGGQRLVLADGPGAISITDSNGNSVKLESSGVNVTASAKISIRASLVELDAGMFFVNAGMAKFSGVVRCDTLVSNSVVSASYTPGAGNIW